MPLRKVFYAATTTGPTQSHVQPTCPEKIAENKPPQLRKFLDAPADPKPRSATRKPSPRPTDAQMSPHKRPSHKYDKHEERAAARNMEPRPARQPHPKFPAAESTHMPSARDSSQTFSRSVCKSTPAARASRPNAPLYKVVLAAQSRNSGSSYSG